jgi:DNA repair exonuclease SbcCD nuclease subunit
MKVAIITDTHWGARNDSLAFIEFYRKFYEYFFKTLDEHKIDTVLMLGDTFDRRKYTNHATIKASKDIYFEELYKRDIKTYILVGNHDTFYKNTNEVNTIDLMLGEYTNLVTISKPKTLEIDSVPISFIPWICADNYADSMNELSTTRAEICMGHLEIQGFEMYRGQECHEGFSMDTFKRFDTVFSGHYHHRSTKGNITYLGTPYELTWQDYNDPKGFHFFDLHTRQLEFFQNPYTMFVRLEYNDKNQEPIDLDALDLKDTYVKLVVVNKTDYYKFDQFVNKLYTKKAHDIKIMEDLSEFEEGAIDDNIDLEDTQSILANYIDSLSTDVDKEKIKSYMKALYTEAVNTEVV